jgi:hypothetical protein
MDNMTSRSKDMGRTINGGLGDNVTGGESGGNLKGRNTRETDLS